MTKEEEDPSHLKDIPRERSEPRPDFSKPPARKQLPKEIQDTLNNEEKLWDTLYEGKGADSTESDLRYAAYASRLRTIMMSAHRYVAYTSDIGESFRPIAHPYMIRTAYGISWAYLVGDVAHEGYKAWTRNQQTLHPSETKLAPSVPDDGQSEAKSKSKETAQNIAAMSKDLVKPAVVAPLDDYRTVMAQRAIFQGLASMGLPAFTIHSIVRYSGRALKSAKNTTIRTWGPIGLGLAAVPFLPFVFDEPVEKATEWVFEKGFELAGKGREHGQGSESKKEL